MIPDKKMTNTKRYEWKDIIAILDPNRQIAISVNNHGQIDLTRRLERIKTEYRPVWSKTYIKKSMGFEGTREETDKLEQDNKFHLAISEHELNVLQELARKKLHYCSLPFQINQKFHSTFTHTVESVDAGLSLDYWHYMENFLPANPFSDPVAFLRLTRGVLQALSEFHHADFIHLDLNWGNVCMPSLETTFSDDLSSVTLTPNWNSIKLIDFAYSVSPDNSPKVCFKHGYTSRFENVKNEIAKYVIAEYTKRKNSNTPSWEVALHDPDWWGVLSRRKELRKFSDNLDWREDIHALGEMLTEVTYISKHARNNVNELVESLPTLLMTQGLSDSVPSNLPHEDWIKQIDKVLDLCPDDMQATEVFHLVNKRSPDTKTFRYKSETQYAPPKRQPPWPQHAFTYLASVVTSLNQVARSVPSALRKKPHLSLLAVASVVFVVLAIAMDRMGKDPIGLPLGATAALVVLMVSVVAVWKFAFFLARGITQYITALAGSVMKMAKAPLRLVKNFYLGSKRFLLIVFSACIDTATGGYRFIKWLLEFCVTETLRITPALLIPLVLLKAVLYLDMPWWMNWVALFVGIGGGGFISFIIGCEMEGHSLHSIASAYIALAKAFTKWFVALPCTIGLIFFSKIKRVFARIELGNKRFNVIKNVWHKFCQNYPILGWAVKIDLFCFLIVVILESYEHIFILLGLGDCSTADFSFSGRDRFFFDGCLPLDFLMIVMLPLTTVLFIAMEIAIVNNFGRIILILYRLLLRAFHGLSNVFGSRNINLALLALLVWGAENRYDLIAQANKTYAVWHQAPGYAEASQQIKLGGWWKGERAANAQESAWLKTTGQLSEFGWPQAMFMTALTRCYGMQDGRQAVLPSEHNLADCGPLLDAALQQGAQRWHILVNSSGWSTMLEDTAGVLESTFNYTRPPAEYSIRFAQALTLGLEAAAPYNDYLAYTLADIQACWLKPSQHNSAVHTLQALIERFPDSELAKRAGEHLPGLELFCEPL